jgi:hypothetical protein
MDFGHAVRCCVLLKTALGIQTEWTGEPTGDKGLFRQADALMKLEDAEGFA